MFYIGGIVAVSICLLLESTFVAHSSSSAASDVLSVSSSCLNTNDWRSSALTAFFHLTNPGSMN